MDNKKQLRTKVKDFNRRSKQKSTFQWQDIIEMTGWDTTCYLTGRKIDLRQPETYQFDHKIPCSKGGNSTLQNLGVACKDANFAKGDLSIDEFIELCKDVLINNGYSISWKQSCL